MITFIITLHCLFSFFLSYTGEHTHKTISVSSYKKKTPVCYLDTKIMDLSHSHTKLTNQFYVQQAALQEQKTQLENLKKQLSIFKKYQEEDYASLKNKDEQIKKLSQQNEVFKGNIMYLHNKIQSLTNKKRKRESRSNDEKALSQPLRTKKFKTITSPPTPPRTPGRFND